MLGSCHETGIGAALLSYQVAAATVPGKDGRAQRCENAVKSSQSCLHVAVPPTMRGCAACFA